MSWRQGSKVPLNVYEGDRPVCQCHTELDAIRIVAAFRALEQIRHIRDQIPWDAAAAASWCIQIAKRALGELASTDNNPSPDAATQKKEERP